MTTMTLAREEVPEHRTPRGHTLATKHHGQSRYPVTQRPYLHPRPSALARRSGAGNSACVANADALGALGSSAGFARASFGGGSEGGRAPLRGFDTGSGHPALRPRLPRCISLSVANARRNGSGTPSLSSILVFDYRGKAVGWFSHALLQAVAPSSRGKGDKAGRKTGRLAPLSRQGCRVSGCRALAPQPRGSGARKEPA